MTELCKHQIKDKEKSTWLTVVFRNCKLEVHRDGFCNLHHPQSIAYARERSVRYELGQELRAVERQAESVVGAYMRLRRKEDFDAILAEVESANDLSAEMRGRAR